MLKKASLNLQFLIAKKTKGRKIVVFESDDWGGIGMSSPESYRTLEKKYPEIQNDRYLKYDHLEQKKDIEALGNVLSAYKDKNGRNPVFTMNFTCGNPDFDEIRANTFAQYFWEPFTRTYSRSPHNPFETIKKGIDGSLFFPQYHGREHVNAHRWLNALAHGNTRQLDAFDLKVFGLSEPDQKAEYYKAALSFNNVSEISFLQKSLVEGLEVFKDSFGFVPTTFVPPCYVLPKELYSMLLRTGVKASQGKLIGLRPMESSNEKLKKVLRIPGRKKHGLISLVRNVFFEPNQEVSHMNWVDNSLYRISLAFKYNVPAIISTHRVNFIGGMDESNREKGLRDLETLLSKISSTWPQVEYLNSSELVT